MFHVNNMRNCLAVYIWSTLTIEKGKGKKKHNDTESYVWIEMGWSHLDNNNKNVDYDMNYPPQLFIVIIVVF